MALRKRTTTVEEFQRFPWSITMGVLAAATVAWGVGLLPGCGTVDGIGRDLRDGSARMKSALDQHLWGDRRPSDEGPLELHTEIVEVER